MRIAEMQFKTVRRDRGKRRVGIAFPELLFGLGTLLRPDRLLWDYVRHVSVYARWRLGLGLFFQNGWRRLGSFCRTAS